MISVIDMQRLRDALPKRAIVKLRWKQNKENRSLFIECIVRFPSLYDKGTKEEEKQLAKWTAKEVYLRITVSPGAVCNFSYSADGKSFEKIPGSFTAKPGKWVGAKFGLFATSTFKTNDAGYADIDWFRLSKPE